MTGNGGKPHATSGTVIPGAPVFIERNFSPDRTGVRIDFGSYVLLGAWTEEGWILESETLLRDSEVRRFCVSPSGFRYRCGDRIEAWADRFDRDSRGADGWALMLADGKLFRSVQTGLLDPRVELVDWESGAPYWIATPDADRWKLTPTAAGSGLEQRETLLAPWALAIVNADLHR